MARRTASSPSLRSLLGLAVTLLLVLGGTRMASWWQDERAGEQVRTGSLTHPVLIYTTSTCPYCARAISWLTRHGANWRECNIELDSACLRRYQEQGAPGVPLLQVNGQWHLGFNANWVASVMTAAPQEPGKQATQASSPSVARLPRP